MSFHHRFSHHFPSQVTHDFHHSPQPKLADGYPNYTNCILTLIWSDGKPRTPPMMFTNDPKFRDSAVTTDIRKKLRSECESVMKEYGVSPNQVVWMGGGSHYVPERTDLLKIYGAKVKVPDNLVIFSDKGNTFFQDKQPVIPLIFRSRTATFPPAIHHCLSPNDNRYHGVAKAQWRAEAAKQGWGKEDSLRSSLYLLSCLNKVEPETIRGYFAKNFFLTRKCVKPDRCLDLVTNGMMRILLKNDFFIHSLSVYRRFREDHEKQREKDLSHPPPELMSTLDGDHWK